MSPSTGDTSAWPTIGNLDRDFPYKILDDRPIGAGGFGAVFLAEDKSQKKCVIKLLRPDVGEQAHQRFLAEMDALTSVSGKENIVKPIDVGRHKHRYFLVMEYVGDSLETITQNRQTGFEIVAACRIIRQVACGLAEIHSSDLVHRDIKPANILLSKDGSVKVADFGLVQFTSRLGLLSETLTAEGTFVGSIEYMAPEQMSIDSRVDARADLYAVGCVLYFLINRQPPYPVAPNASMAERFSQLVMQQRLGTVPPLLTGQSCPRLENLYVRLMGLSPDERPSSASAVIRQIDEVMSSIGSGVSPQESSLLHIGASDASKAHTVVATRMARRRFKQRLYRRLAASLIGSIVLAGFFGVFFLVNDKKSVSGDSANRVQPDVRTENTRDSLIKKETREDATIGGRRIEKSQSLSNAAAGQPGAVSSIGYLELLEADNWLIDPSYPQNPLASSEIFNLQTQTTSNDPKLVNYNWLYAKTPEVPQGSVLSFGFTSDLDANDLTPFVACVLEEDGRLETRLVESLAPDQPIQFMKPSDGGSIRVLIRVFGVSVANAETKRDLLLNEFKLDVEANF